MATGNGIGGNGGGRGGGQMGNGMDQEYNGNERNYDDMLEDAKRISKAMDEMVDKAVLLQLRFAELLSRMASLVDPETNSMLFEKLPGEPDFQAYVQMFKDLPPGQLDEKFKEALIWMENTIKIEN